MTTVTGTQERRPIALVTGASAGIGAEFARQLAADGHNLVLVARDAGRLESMAKELDDSFGATSEVLPADLTTPDGLAMVEGRLQASPPVDVLINNAGFGTFGKFHELPLDGEDREVRLNVLAVLRLSHVAASVMVERRRGAILNVSSIAGAQPIPGNATYAATKAFVTTFTEALHEEVRNAGVHVTVLCPGFTRTEFQERSGFDQGRVPSFAWQNADQVVTAALDALKKNHALCVPGALNKLTNALSSATPHAITRRVAGTAVRHV